MPIPRRRLATNTAARQQVTPSHGGRPRGSRNKVTNLVVAGITEAIMEYGEEYAKANGLPRSHDPMADVEAFKNFIKYCIDKDLRGVLSLIKGMIPKDVTLTIAAPVQVEVLRPRELITVLEQKGLRLPPQYQLSAAHANDDDDVTEADIVRVVEGS